MTRHLRSRLTTATTAALAAMIALLSSQPAVASALAFTIRDGRVTIIATAVTVEDILTEWARIGRTEIVNIGNVNGPPVTLELRDVPEAEALGIVLRSVSGYVAVARTAPVSAGSVFGSIVILATSQPPAPAPAAAEPAPPARPPLLVTALAPAGPAPLNGGPLTLRAFGLAQPAGSQAASGANPSAGERAPRFTPLTTVELAGVRLTRELQRNAIVRHNSAPPPPPAPPSTDASRPGGITTVAPQQNQRPGAPRR